MRSDRRSASRDAEKPRLPQVDGAGRDREQLARKALAAFGGRAAAGSSAASGPTAKRPGGRLVSGRGAGAIVLQAGAAKLGAKRGPITDDLAEPEDVGTDVVAEEASTDLDPEEAGSDVEREWADGAPTVRDSKPSPL